MGARRYSVRVEILRAYVLPIGRAGLLFSVFLSGRRIVQCYIGVHRGLFTYIYVGVELREPSVHLDFLVILMGEEDTVPRYFMRLRLSRGVGLVHGFRLRHVRIARATRTLLSLFAVNEITCVNALRGLYSLVTVLQIGVNSVVASIFVDGNVVCQYFLATVSGLVYTLSQGARGMLLTLANGRRKPVNRTFFRSYGVHSVLQFHERYLAG